MRNDFGTRSNVRFPYKKSEKKQTSNDRLDESLGERDGAESTKTQSYKSRRDESRGSTKS
jgi:hypothetical protein